MATYAQCRYLNTLAQECRARGIEIPEEIKSKLHSVSDLTAQESSELIDALKFELGWEQHDV